MCHRQQQQFRDDRYGIADSSAMIVPASSAEVIWFFVLDILLLTVSESFVYYIASGSDQFNAIIVFNFLKFKLPNSILISLFLEK